MKRNPGADETRETIRARYDDYTTLGRRRRPAPQGQYVSGNSATGDAMARMIGTVVGMGTGVLLLALAALAFAVAGGWNAAGRDAAAIGYTVTALCLVIAGLGALIGTYHHNFRVLDPNRTPAHGHH